MTNKEKSVLFGTEFDQNCESNSNFYIKKPKITLKYEKNLKGNFLMKQFVRYVINSIRYRRFCFLSVLLKVAIKSRSGVFGHPCGA